MKQPGMGMGSEGGRSVISLWMGSILPLPREGGGMGLKMAYERGSQPPVGDGRRDGTRACVHCWRSTSSVIGPFVFAGVQRVPDPGAASAPPARGHMWGKLRGTYQSTGADATERRELWKEALVSRPDGTRLDKWTAS